MPPATQATAPSRARVREHWEVSDGTLPIASLERANQPPLRLARGGTDTWPPAADVGGPQYGGRRPARERRSAGTSSRAERS